MKYYMYKERNGYADEFTVYGVTLLTSDDRKSVKKKLKKLSKLLKKEIISEEDVVFEYSFGSNESIKFDIMDFDVYDFIEISEEEYSYLSRLLGTSYGHTFYDRIVESIDELLEKYIEKEDE